MGGDVGCDVVVPAAMLALDKHPDVDVILVGDTDTLQQALRRAGGSGNPHSRLATMRRQRASSTAW